MLEEGFRIKVLAVAALRIGVVAGKESRLHQVEIAIDVVVLLGGNVIIARMFDGDRIPAITFEPAYLLVSIGIHFNKIAASKLGLFVIPRLHLGDRDTILIH